jgi:hypothetical protein
MVNRPHIKIEKKRENMSSDKCGNTRGKECHVKGSRKETQEFIYRDTSNVECEIYYYTCNNWSHRNINKSSKEKFGSRNRKAFNTFSRKDNYRIISNVTHNTGSTLVYKLKSERRERYHCCFKRRSTRNKRPVTRSNKIVIAYV